MKYQNTSKMTFFKFLERKKDRLIDGNFSTKLGF